MQEDSLQELKCSVVKCVVCGVGNVFEKRSYEKEPLTIYGRNGPREVRHLVSRCTNHTCRIGHFHGYISYNGMTIYNNDALKNDVLVTSSCTGFDIEYLVELQPSALMVKVLMRW